MDQCNKCGSLLFGENRKSRYSDCGPSTGSASMPLRTDGGSTNDSESTTELERLPTTAHGNIKKADAMAWLADRPRPSNADLRQATLEKPNDFSGSTFATDISKIRVTGNPEFIETIAGLFSWFIDMEDYSRRVEINLQQTKEKESGELTGNYALYLSVAERG